SFIPDAVDSNEARMLIAAASRVLRQEVAVRIRCLAADADDVFAIDAGGMVLWHGAAVGRLAAGDRMLAPRVDPITGRFVEGEGREGIRQRLQAFLRAEIERRLAPLFVAQALPFRGVARGLVFHLVDELGCLPKAEVRHQLKTLESPDRIALN